MTRYLPKIQTTGKPPNSLHRGQATTENGDVIQSALTAWPHNHGSGMMAAWNDAQALCAALIVGEWSKPPPEPTYPTAPPKIDRRNEKILKALLKPIVLSGERTLGKAINAALNHLHRLSPSLWRSMRRPARLH